MRKRATIIAVTSAFLAVVIFLSGCGHQDKPQVPSADAKLRHALTGTWTNPWGVMVLEPDGSFWTHGEEHSHPMRVWAYEGLWTATNSVLVFTCTNSRSWGTTNRSPTGTETARIVSMDERTLRLAGAPYQTNSFTRSN
jgi:hypothetical protein